LGQNLGCSTGSIRGHSHGRKVLIGMGSARASRKKKMG
jgi:hypothetical protein